MKHVVLFIGKELAEDRRSCHQIFVASIAELNLLIPRKSSFSSASNLFLITVLKILVFCCFFLYRLEYFSTTLGLGLNSVFRSQAIVIHILPSILRSKDSQTMKFGQLIEFNRSNIKKSHTKCDGETSLRPFSEKLKFSISLDQ